MTQVREDQTRLSLLVVLVVGSITFAFLLAEIAFRVAGYQPLAVNAEQVNFWRYDPSLGWSHRPGQQGVFEKSGLFRTRVSINSRGLRDEEHDYQRGDARKRILVLGDSFAFGFGVEAEERFSEGLERSLDVESINAGVSGYGTDQELIWYEEEGTRYDVDLVLLLFCGNDEGTNYLERVYAVYSKPVFEEVDGDLELRGRPVPETSVALRVAHFLRRHSALVYFMQPRIAYLLSGEAPRTKTPFQAADAPLPEAPFPLTAALIERMRERAAEHGARFMVVGIERWWDNPDGVAYADFLAELARRGIPLLDVENLPDFDFDAMTIPEDGHWNPQGHAFVAEKIREFIEREGLLD